MTEKSKEEIASSIRDFRLPRYEEIPNVGLYLEQTTKYINEYLEPLQVIGITGSMVSNYVKKGIISNPIKKQYNREQIAYLIYIAIAKAVLSLEHIHLLIEMQKRTYESRVAYDYFCREFEYILSYVFGFRDSIGNVGAEASDEKVLLRNMIITVAHKIYLDKCICAMGQEKGEI